MIPERSSDIEDWSNDAENSALHYRNKLHFKLESKVHRYKLLCWLGKPFLKVLEGF